MSFGWNICRCCDEPDCNFSDIQSGGAGVTEHEHIFPDDAEEIFIEFDAYTIKDALTVWIDGSEVINTGLMSGKKTWCFPKTTGYESTVKLRIEGEPGTGWKYSLNCKCVKPPPPKPCCSQVYYRCSPELTGGNSTFMGAYCNGDSQVECCISQFNPNNYTQEEAERQCSNGYRVPICREDNPSLGHKYYEALEGLPVGCRKDTTARQNWNPMVVRVDWRLPDEKAAIDPGGYGYAEQIAFFEAVENIVSDTFALRELCTISSQTVFVIDTLLPNGPGVDPQPSTITIVISVNLQQGTYVVTVAVVTNGIARYTWVRNTVPTGTNRNYNPKCLSWSYTLLHDCVDPSGCFNQQFSNDPTIYPRCDWGGVTLQ